MINDFFSKGKMYRSFHYEMRHKSTLHNEKAGVFIAEKSIKFKSSGNRVPLKFTKIVSWFIFAILIAGFLFIIFKFIAH